MQFFSEQSVYGRKNMFPSLVEGLYTKLETRIGNEKIPCFLVDGEKRLVLSIFLNNVLKEISLKKIYQVCEKMNIVCARCNPQQLMILKSTRVIPYEAPNCGLINKSDAERLLDYFIPVETPKYTSPISEDALHVHHHCFGRESGFFEEKLYNSATDRCIICEKCCLLLNPEDFVMHSHSNKMRVTKHLGLDREKWRHFIFPCDENDVKALATINKIKNKFIEFNDLNFRQEDPVRDIDVKNARVLSSFPKKPGKLEMSGDLSVIMTEFERMINKSCMEINAKVNSVSGKNARLESSIDLLRCKISRKLKRQN